MYCRLHCDDFIMGAIASQITSLTIVYSIVYSDADQRKHQSSVSLAFVRGIHRGPVNSPHKGPVTLKMFPFHDVIMWKSGPMPRSLPTNLKYGMPIYRGQHQCSLMSQLHANSLDFKFVRMSCIALKGKSTYWLIAFSPLTALKFVTMTILYTWRPFCFSIRYNSKGHFFPLW